MVADWIVDIGPGAGEHGGEVVFSGPVHGVPGPHRLDHRGLSVGAPADPGSDDPASAGPVAADQGARRSGAQPAQRQRGVPARLLRRRHGGQRLRQVHAGQRRAVRGAGARAQPGPDRSRPAFEGDRPGAAGQGRARRPVADRPHPALEPGHLHRPVRPRPEAVRADRGGQGPRIPAGEVQLQREGRPLRGLHRRRNHQDRDELPARRLRALRRVPRREVQPGDPRGPLQGQDHRRGPRHAHRGGQRLLRRHPARSPATSPRWSRWGSGTCASASPPPRCPAARRSG